MKYKCQKNKYFLDSLEFQSSWINLVKRWAGKLLENNQTQIYLGSFSYEKNWEKEFFLLFFNENNW